MAASKLGPKARTAGTVGDTANRTAHARSGELSKLSLDDDFVSVGRPHARWMVLFYGPNRIGKTHLLTKIPGILILPVEKGANQSKAHQWTKTPLATLAELHDALDHLRFAQHSFQAVGIEMIGAVERLIRMDIEEKLLAASALQKDDRNKAVTIQELNEKEYGAGSKLMADAWQVLLDKCDALRDEKGMDVVWTGYDKVNTVKPLDGLEYQRVEPMIEGQGCAKLLKGRCDYIVKLDQPIEVREDERTKRKTSTQGMRVMRCVQTATLDVGCRGDAVWPDALPLDWDDPWGVFRNTAQLILDHGDNVAGYLATEAARAFATIGEKPGVAKTAAERRTDAEAYFLAAAARRDYHAMDFAVKKADREAAERMALAKNVAGTVPRVVAKAEEAEWFEGRLGAP